MCDQRTAALIPPSLAHRKTWWRPAHARCGQISDALKRDWRTPASPSELLQQICLHTHCAMRLTASGHSTLSGQGLWIELPDFLAMIRVPSISSFVELPTATRTRFGSLKPFRTAPSSV